MIRAAMYSLTIVATAGLAAASAGAAPADNRKPADPNEVVCEKQTVVGSRLAVKRVCMTRAQWAEQRQADRMELDKIQNNRGLRGE